jgi:MCM N-terminal domain
MQVEVGFKLEDQQGPAAEWIALDPVQRDIKRKFRKMLLGFQTDKDGPRHYMDAIKRMCRGTYALALPQFWCLDLRLACHCMPEDIAHRLQPSRSHAEFVQAATKLDFMCAANKQSLEVSYAHLSQACPILAVWVADVPKQMFAMFNEVAHQVCTGMLLFSSCLNAWQW